MSKITVKIKSIPRLTQGERWCLSPLTELGGTMIHALNDAKKYRWKNYKAVIVRVDDVICGWALVIEDDEPEVHFYVDPHRRRMNLGMILAEKVIEKYGPDCYHVRDRNPKFFKSAGFNKEFEL